MDGVVSMLDDTHDDLVESIWAEFKRNFGVHGVHATPFAHFSYHVAARYDVDKLKRILQPFADTVTPFRVQTNGLGIFTGEHPVLYVPIRRTPELIAIHERLWKAVEPAARESSPFYRPETWFPHITLAHGDIDHQGLPDIIRLLSRRSFTWDIAIDNIAIIYEEEGIQRLNHRFEFPL